MIQHRIKEREPQYMDMKEIITEAARKLVLEKKVKKLTVRILWKSARSPGRHFTTISKEYRI